MSLAPSEQQTLAEMESRLRWSDPKLAARLALFRRRASGRILVLAVAIAVAVLGLALAGHGGQPHGAAAAMCVITAGWHRSRPARSPADGTYAGDGTYAAGSLYPADGTYPA